MLKFWVRISAPLVLMTMPVFAFQTGKVALNHAVTLYHQSHYDSSLLQLQNLQPTDLWKRRDSLSLYHYLGMASAKLGRDSLSLTYFSDLLQIDSLFQLPKNEDAIILKIFSRAQDSRAQAKVTPKISPPESTAPKSPIEPVATLIETIATLAPVVPMAPMTPLNQIPPSPKKSKIGFAYGAIPLGTGWMVREHKKTGLTLGILQVGGLLVSLYASGVQSRQQGDPWGTQKLQEKAQVEKYQWIQRISISTAVGAYLFSLFASVGE